MAPFVWAWFLVLVALEANPNYPTEIVLSLRSSQVECEEFKLTVLKQAIMEFRLEYPLNFRLDCREVQL